MNKPTCLALFVLSVFIWPLLPSSGQHSSERPRQRLEEYVALLQKNPDDQDLREKIIKLVLTLKPAPAIPDKALEAEGAAEFAFKHAQSKDDYSNAAKQYKKAVLVAPWSARYYFNLALCYEKAEHYDEAITNYNLYLLAAPDAKDRDEVLKKIGAMKYAAENSRATHRETAANSAPVPPLPISPEEKERKLADSLDGVCFLTSSDTIPPFAVELLIEGGYLWDAEKNLYSRVDGSFHWTELTQVCRISGLSCSFTVPVPGLGNNQRTWTVTISPDGRTIDRAWRDVGPDVNDFSTRHYIYVRVSSCPKTF